VKVLGVDDKVSDFIVSCIEAMGVIDIEFYNNINERFIDFIQQESMTMEKISIFSKDVWNVLKYDNINLEFNNGIEGNRKIKE
jgi:hypothetical protein